MNISSKISEFNSYNFLQCRCSQSRSNFNRETSMEINLENRRYIITSVSVPYREHALELLAEKHCLEKLNRDCNDNNKICNILRKMA